jgi:2-aminoadipate transaminase
VNKSDVQRTEWAAHFADTTRRNRGNAIRDLLSVIGTETISFAGGLPAPEVFAVEEAAVAADEILAKDGRSALQYGPTEGFRPLRDLLASQWRAKGLQIEAENILITSGAQQGIDLVGRVFLEPGDRVVVESPTYVGALSAWFGCQSNYLTVPMDDNGMQVDQLDSLIKDPVKFLYSVVNFQNPTGVTLSLERRQQLLELAHRRDFAVIEDDPYRALRYSGQDVPGLIELEGQMLGSHWNEKGRVIHFETFSKTLMPGLRVGYTIAPAPVIRAMVIAKQGFDLHTSTLNQMIVTKLVSEGTLERNLPNLISLYRTRRDLMLELIGHHFKGFAEWTQPDGGLFVWLRFPEHIDTEQMLVKALEHHVAYVPGNGFFAATPPMNTLRLNFSNMPPERITEGMNRLAQILRP